MLKVTYAVEAKRQFGVFMLGMSGAFLSVGVALVLTPEFAVAHQFGWIVTLFFAGATALMGVLFLLSAWLEWRQSDNTD